MEAKKKSQLFKALKSGIEKLTVSPNEGKRADQGQQPDQDSLFFDTPDSQSLPRVNAD